FPQKKSSLPNPHKHRRIRNDQGILRESGGNLFPEAASPCLREARGSSIFLCYDVGACLSMFLLSSEWKWQTDPSVCNSLIRPHQTRQACASLLRRLKDCCVALVAGNDPIELL